jgi:hypothetical protein
MITELLREMDLPYKVSDVRTFGHDPDNGFRGSIWVEVIVRGENGVPIGSERIERWIEEDVSYKDWGKGPIPGVVS